MNRKKRRSKNYLEAEIKKEEEELKEKKRRNKDSEDELKRKNEVN